MQSTVSKFAITALLISGCGNPNFSHEEKAARTAEGSTVHLDYRIPPEAYYESLARRLLLAPSEGVVQTLWINYDGAKVLKGYDEEESFIPCQSVSEIPSANLSDSEKEIVTDAVIGYYADARVQINIVEAKPAKQPYLSMHVGGTYDDLGCSGGSGVLGVAPLDRGNASISDVAFSFAKAHRSLKTLGETIAHEAGHAFGLDHINNDEAIMHAVDSPNIVGFSEGYVNRSRYQDSVALLHSNVGEGLVNEVVEDEPVEEIEEPVAEEPIEDEPVEDIEEPIEDTPDPIDEEVDPLPPIEEDPNDSWDVVDFFDDYFGVVLGDLSWFELFEYVSFLRLDPDYQGDADRILLEALRARAT